MPDPASSTNAADLRIGLIKMLGEHVLLATAAINAALGGREPEFERAASVLDSNWVAIAEAIGSVYGADAGDAFPPLWRQHIGFFVDYAKGRPHDDPEMSERARASLEQYAGELDAFIHSASPELPAPSVTELVRGHAASRFDVTGARAAGNQAKAFAAPPTHLPMIADPLAAAIAKQIPQTSA